MTTNEDRAEWARDAVQDYADEHGPKGTPEDEECATSDLLCNMLHLVRAQGRDPKTVLDAAFACFTEEEAEEA